ncbi:hypothetical protein HHK36_014737 [Tetracentron sinense]|uniref:Uncharacterized protein n=1 Tax=Tetracentron sinense TaxID=13715 RepID=A0A834Z612_TETSI|nr:hypothetical protein HHK36_014737 [Tetracentron sinense]
MSWFRLSGKTHLLPGTRRVLEALEPAYNGSANIGFPHNLGYQFWGSMSSSKFSTGPSVNCHRGSPFSSRSFERSCSLVGFRRYYVSHTANEKKSRKMLLYLTALVCAMVGCTYASVPLYRRFCQATGYGGTVQRRESVEEKIARHAKDGTAPTRELVVQFNADVADGMQWKFVPTQREVRVKPGESALAFYTAENCSSTPITGVSTYNVTPMKSSETVEILEKVYWHNALNYTACKMVNQKVSENGVRLHLLAMGDGAMEFELGESDEVATVQAAVYFNKIQCFCFEEQRLLPGEQIDMPVFFYIDPEFETDPRMDGSLFRRPLHIVDDGLSEFIAKETCL